MPSENTELRNAGLKVTLPRVKILQILEASEERQRRGRLQSPAGAR